MVGSNLEVLSGIVRIVRPRMHIRLVCAFCPWLVLIGTLASCQMNSGTVVVFYISDDKIAISADSRSLIVRGDKVTSVNDQTCKIAALGDHALFGASGFARYIKSGHNDPAPEYDFATNARRAYSANSRAIASVAESWAKEVIPQMTAVLRLHPGTFSFLKGEFAGGGVFLTSTYYGEIRVYAVNVSYHKDNAVAPFTSEVLNLAPCTTAIGPYCVLGKTEVAMEFASLKTARARQEAATWEARKSSRVDDDEALRTARLVDLSIAYAPDRYWGYADVAGAVDTAILKRGGTVQWLARKSECPAN